MNITTITKCLSLPVLFAALTAGWAAESTVSAPSQLTAKSYALVDGEGSQALVENNGDQRLPPTSLAKLMTTYIAIKEIEAGHTSENNLVTVSEYAWRIGDSRMSIKVGSQVSASDLLHGIIVQSGNDASAVLVEHVVGSENVFADMVNTTAQKLGPINLHSMDATGLPNPDHYSSARDMAMPTCAIIYDEPSRYAIYAQREFLWNSIKRLNRSPLLWRDRTIDSLKTGHTGGAGYCPVVSTIHDGQRMIAMVSGINGEQARVAETQELLTYGFRFFESRNSCKKGTELTKGLVRKGSEREVKAGLAEDPTMTLPRGQTQKLQAGMVPEPQLMAPIQQGQVIGKAEVKLDGKVIRSTNLVVLNIVEEGGFFRRLWDSIRLLSCGLFNWPTGVRPFTRPVGACPHGPRVHRRHDRYP